MRHLPLLSSLLLTGCGVSQDPGTPYVGALYAMTNAENGNAVVHYGRGADGALTRLASVATGGDGVGAKMLPGRTQDSVNPLNSSNALKLSPDKRFVFAVNAGSNTVTSFRVNADFSLTRVDVEPSGGLAPNAIAVHGDLLYVANAGNAAAGTPATLTGFRVDTAGGLAPLVNSRRTLAHPGTSLPTELLFSPDGARLLASDFTTSVVSLFPVGADGTLGAPTHSPSAAPNPFQAQFLDPDTVIVSEANGGTRDISGLSSYRVEAGGALTPISGAVSDAQAASCWVVLTPDHRYAYTSNTTSGSVSAYRVGENGELTLLASVAARRDPQGGLPTSGPIDMAVSEDGRFLYQQFGGLGVTAAYRIGEGGSLTPVTGGDGAGLPAPGAQGLAGF
ncbi:hypothetical protein DAETH_36680 (plasmid) [Deinococcus aetherius]|uniref:3-carboxymuconate cyclase n=1 Tax=Deinococcus aetherius TaxID=200252 RepID=A0ABN6RLF7_9DEIO|nr:lactonase family protein [Deinococcus aetherius]BDP43699.1 hypothetical protein DAETH_36680 [Deinococcus aetherius]